MRNFLRDCLLSSFSLYLVAGFYSGLVIPLSFLALLLAGLTFTLINLFIKPIVKLFLLPLNLLTLGLFHWVANVVALLVLTQINPAIRIVAFTTATFTYSGFVVPAISLNLVLAYVLASLSLSLVFNILDSILCG